jgi:hypothetical protein
MGRQPPAERSLPVGSTPAETPESSGRWLLRHLVVLWLLLLQPLSLALTLDRALPRMTAFGAAAWTLVAVRLGVVVAGIAVARPLRARAAAWGGVALCAAGGVAATLLERLWPELPTGLAPSEARAGAWVAVVRDVGLVLVAVRLAYRDHAARDSS